MRLRSFRCFTLLAIGGAVAVLAGCGGSSSSGGAPSNGKSSGNAALKARQGAIGLVTPHPIPRNQRADPDSMPMGGGDLAYTVRSVGTDTYKLLIQNTSRIGFIDTVEFKPPYGAKIEAVETSTAGSCKVLAGRITCTGLHLKPPKCTCRAGGAATVTFKMRVAVQHGLQTGLLTSAAQVDAMTPVPWQIPSELGQPVSPQADLPICKANVASTKAHPCVPA
jgi:hypothetical protein